MLYPVGVPSVLKNMDGISALEFSDDGQLCAAVSDTCLSIFLLMPLTKVCGCNRSFKSVKELGVTEAARWKSDSTKVVITTSNGSCLIFELTQQRIPETQLYHSLQSLKREAFADFALKQVALVSIGSRIDALCSVGDRVCVADCNGWLRQFYWNDGLQVKNQCRNISTIPFAYDLHPSRASLLGDGMGLSNLSNAISTMNGLLCVLTDGRAAILACEANSVDFNHMQGVFAPNVSDANTVCLNSKLRQMVLSTRSGNILIYAMNELTNELVMTCKYRIRQRTLSTNLSNGPYAVDLSITNDGLSMCALLSNGMYQIYSIFGGLIWESDEEMFSSSSSSHKTVKSRDVQVVRISPSGYQMWICMAAVSPTRERYSALGASSPDSCPAAASPKVRVAADSSVSPLGKQKAVVMTVSLVKNSHSLRSSQFGESFMLLHSYNRIYLSSNKDFESANVIKCWKQALVPSSYMRGGSFVQCCCVDESGLNIAVASQHGLALYNFDQLKWKLFGNEIQEREFSVVCERGGGGMCWFQEFIVCTCLNNDSHRYELRAYSRLKNLENNNKSSINLSRKPMVVNLYNNFFSVLDSLSNLIMFKLEIKINSSSQTRNCELIKLQETPLNMFVPYPYSVLSIMFTDVAHQMGNYPIREEKPRSFLINVSGRLAIFPRDPTITDLEISEQVPLCTPTVIASNVESLSLYNSNHHKFPASEYFKDSVWLMCGAFGLKVWLPLPPQDVDAKLLDGLRFKRSVFVFHPNNYPLAFECNSGFIMGVDCDNLVQNSVTTPHPAPHPVKSSELTGFGFADWSNKNNSPHVIKVAQPSANYILSKTLEMFIPQLIEEMLRRNLTSHAIRLMKSVECLSSFDHVLELLLHNVLEAEATASEPIADPLLPCVINLLNEQYPKKFLNILAKCARKTEVAIWNFLFNAAGNPADYFRRCIEEKELSTAASYLIILQNLEPLSVSKQYANVLVDTCLEHRDWLLVRDIIRFLKSIAASSPGDEISPKVTSRVPHYTTYAYLPPPHSSQQQVANNSCSNSSSQSPPLPPNSAVVTPSAVRSSSRTSSQQQQQQTAFFSSSSTSINHQSSTSSAIGPLSPTGGNVGTAKGFNFQKTSASRTCSIENELNSSSAHQRPSLSLVNESTSPGFTANQSSSLSAYQQPDSSDIFYLSSLIARRARTLLVGCEVKQLFLMASHIGFNLTSWLKRERNRAAKIEHYESALESLHREFEWPFPVLADHSKVFSPSSNETFTSSTLSSSPTASSIVTLQDFPRVTTKTDSNHLHHHHNSQFESVNSPVALSSPSSSSETSTAKSPPIPIPISATWLQAGTNNAPSLYSSLNADKTTAATNNSSSLLPGLQLELESLSMDAISSGLTPNQNALQHARLQLADLSSSFDGSSSVCNLPQNNSNHSNLHHNNVDLSVAAAANQDTCSAWSDDHLDLTSHATTATNCNNQSHISNTYHHTAPLNDVILAVENVTNTAQHQLSESADLESLVQKFKNRGSEKNKILLKYTLSKMIESECYEWAILLCLMLSDVTQAISIINNIIASSTLVDVGQRLIDGLTSLDSWAAQNCFTYRLFLAALFPYVQVLKTVMDFSFKTQKAKKNLSTRNVANKNSKDNVGLLMPASQVNGNSRVLANKKREFESRDNESMSSSTSMAANRRLSWWRSGTNNSANQNSTSSSSEKHLDSNTDLATDNKDDKEMLAQLQDERIEWLTDSYKHFSSRVEEKDAALGSSELFAHNYGDFATQDMEVDIDSSNQRCVIS